MRCLIIDNYDSFTWNLADYVETAYGTAPTVIRNDQYSWDEARQLQVFDSVIVSPGPGSVTNPADFHVSRMALEQDDIPVLGVCLGFQGLAHIYGGNIERAPVPFHGRVSQIRHDGSALFRDIPPAFDAVRYHSLMVTPASVPAVLAVTAQTDCGLVMALQHRSLPKWGVQFHPESILSQFGRQMISNFHDLSQQHARKHSKLRHWTVPAALTAAASPSPATAAPAPLQVWQRELHSDASPVDIFSHLYAQQPHCFWLDTQSAGDGSPRFSFMGMADEHDLLSHSISPGADGEQRASAFLDDLDRQLEAWTVLPEAALPFAFRGGYVGYLNYEMKAGVEARRWRTNSQPDALWMRVTRFLAFDHHHGKAWMVALAPQGQPDGVETWMEQTAQAVAAAVHARPAPASLAMAQLSVVMNMGRDDYLAAIAHCQEKIRAGESYEICLTNLFEAQLDLDPYALYLTMRDENPAPFGAYIKSGRHAILSTSPERFLQVDAAGKVQAKPIKGTAARSTDADADAASAAALAASEKDRAENLMIVDLMRNDLKRVSRSGSVNVPKLMEVESYRTVHQLVSTVEAQLQPGQTLVDLLRATFPGGSITGAPKLRTMEIIDELENAPRGVYCGSIGYLGYDRISDLNIAIRSLSYDGKTVRFGAGGAITYLSDPVSEFEEILLKAEAVLRPLWHYVSDRSRPLDYHIKGNFLHL